MGTTNLKGSQSGWLFKSTKIVKYKKNKKNEKKKLVRELVVFK